VLIFDGKRDISIENIIAIAILKRKQKKIEKKSNIKKTKMLELPFSVISHADIKRE
jgi:hypothetical protein